MKQLTEGSLKIFSGFHDEINNCLEDIYKTVGENLNIDTDFMYLDSWNFGYQVNHVDYTEKIDKYLSSNRELTIRSNAQIALLRDCSGFRVKYEQLKKADLSYMKMYTSSAVKYFVLHLDVYWCDWSAMYMRQHSDHYCLITNVEDSEILLLDTFVGNKIHPLDKTFWQNSIKGVLSIEHADQNPVFEYNNVLATALKSKINDLNQISIFMFEVLKYEDLKHYIERKVDVRVCPLIRRLTQIANGRRKFLIPLRKIIPQYYVDSKLELKFVDLAQKWDMVRNYLIKMNLTTFNDIVYELIIKKMEEIIFTERTLYNQLIEIVSNEI